MAEGIWDFLCGFDYAVRGISAFVFAMAFLTAITFPFLEPGTGAYVVSVMNIAILSVLFVMIGTFYVKCNMGYLDESYQE
ncbi:hypothetical protein [Halovenus marina]|jgi:hypothetical protein|uniref:hypothetical protein n=1 Tax=Halovenus marina TaxID=3396621 RepID=UPI003F562248